MALGLSRDGEQRVCESWCLLSPSPTKSLPGLGGDLEPAPITSAWDGPPTTFHAALPILHISAHLDDHRESETEADSSNYGAGHSVTLVGTGSWSPAVWR